VERLGIVCWRNFSYNDCRGKKKRYNDVEEKLDIEEWGKGYI